MSIFIIGGIMKNIKFFPNYKDVFIDEKLKYYFKPICTIGDYHFLTVDGIFCIKSYKFSENYYFGFKLKDGKYEFLGNIDCFGKNDVERLYEILERDFEENKKYYLDKKIKIVNYVENILNKIEGIIFEEEQDLEYYIESFYCYNMAKYYYELKEKVVSVKALTENYGITPEDELLIDKEELKNCLGDFFVNIEDELELTPAPTEDMCVMGMEIIPFTMWGEIVGLLYDEKEDIIYLREQHS